MKKSLYIAFIVLFLLCTGQSFAQTPKAVPIITGNTRVDELISKMTFEEKISMIHGMEEPRETNQGQAGYYSGIPRLGIPSMRLADGPHGVVAKLPSTGMVGTIALAATWSRTDAKEHGIAIGRDARSLGIDIALQPFINVWRDLNFKRGCNTYGEDPFLTGEIGAGLIEGIQSQNVMAQAKHYVAFEAGQNVFIDDQTLHEVYIAPFARAAEAGVASMMCAYNKVNGTYICGNCECNTSIIRDEIGWKGFMTSDWGATHSTNDINCGLDLEMSGISDNRAIPLSDYAKQNKVTYFNLSPNAAIPDSFIANPEEGLNLPVGMRNAVEKGIVSIETINKSVGRILEMMDRFGWLDKAPDHTSHPVDYQANVPTLRKTAVDAAVLLKNEDEALPLKASDLESLALIGPGAGQTISTAGDHEMSLGIPEKQIGTYQVMKQLSPQAKITYAVANDMTGKVIPASMLSHNGKPGLLRKNEVTKTFYVDDEVNFTKVNGKAFPAGSMFTWTGTLTIPSDGNYQVSLQLLGASGYLEVDGRWIVGVGNKTGNLHGEVIKAGAEGILPTTDNLCNFSKDVELAAGAHEISIHASADVSGEPVQVKLAWVTPREKESNYNAAIAAAKNAKTAVVFVWSRKNPPFEKLPGDQEKLLNDIVSVNSNTIVVINSQTPFAMPWLGKVKAVLNMWFPGDEGGWATANLLIGNASPAGRMPISWPKRLEDNIGNDPKHPKRSPLGVGGKTTFTEGLNIGYRYYEVEKKEVLFPFGYGLTYTDFKYSNLKIKKTTDGGLDVSFSIENTGKYDSDEVPQVYIDTPVNAPEGVQFAIKALAGFERVTLKAGESKMVTIHVPARSLEYWSTKDNTWKRALGNRTIHIGASSQDYRLKDNVSLKEKGR